jgi:hypothetical protein
VNDLDIQATISDELVAFANRLAESNPDADYWEIADGLLSGAVHWWLYANAPCGDPDCEDCTDIRTAELRMKTLHDLVSQMAVTSEYYHSPNDEDVAHA